MSVHPLKVAIYVGRGASHSWIWLVDTLDRHGFKNIQFVETIPDLRADVLVVSGGDPFSIFSVVGKDGVSRMRTFIERGGTYLGICAGAYFALEFHGNPYPWLNAVRGEISNFSVNPPPCQRMPHKYTVPYREGFVYHPVREEVTLTWNGRTLRAPLYGGPGMRSSEAETTAVYEAFTERTLFLCDKKEAASTLLGTSALLHKRMGKGQLFLMGPHFEHPYFPEANAALVALLQKIPPRSYGHEHVGEILPETEKRMWVRELKRQVSNGRVAAFSLQDYHWKIGEKIYDPERLAYFFETCFQLVSFFEKTEKVFFLPELVEEARNLVVKTRKLGPDPGEAEHVLEGMKKLTASLYSLYFSTQLQLQPHPGHQKP